ncbi:histidine phosphatase family protein [Rhabdochromatium marinum]|uniref:histidine phosphatase family protein n=1 Tax=Rhabdochromatium marinum TaxID=48729 RepID=UPI0019037EAB|nr:alpha-ribazole phosphatase family protein [Rhabdochromatium marinum]MBK1649851.1 histidine phosphatase family protein [Rhabdochromatium marinum]
MRDTFVDLIRHGEPRGGMMIRGQHADHPLSPLGWQQMNEAVGAAAPWTQIVSSPLSRCRAFASDLAGRHQLPLIIEPELREISMGRWEGRLHREIATTEPEAFINFYRDPATHRPPGGETLEALLARVGPVYDRLVEQHPGQHLLISAHAGVIRAILGHLLKAEPRHWYRLRIDFAGLSRVRHDRFGAGIQYINAQRLREQPVD